MKVPAERPPRGSFVTPALALALASVLATVAVAPADPGINALIVADGRPDGTATAVPTGTSRWLEAHDVAVVCLTLAGLLALVALARLARTPATVRVLGRSPALVAVGAGLVLVPWLPWARIGGDGPWLTGWSVLGGLAWAPVLAGAALVAASAAPPRRALVAVPVAAAALAAIGWLGSTPDVLPAPVPHLGLVLGALLLAAAAALAWTRSDLPRPDRSRVAVLLPPAVALAVASAPWDRAPLGEDGGGLGPYVQTLLANGLLGGEVPRSGWTVAPAGAAALVVVGLLLAVAVARGRERQARGPLGSRDAALLGAAGLAAAAAWLPWIADAASPTTAWLALGHEAWALLAAALALAVAAWRGTATLAARAVPLAAAVVLAACATRGPDTLAPTPGQLTAVTAAALVCAVLLRRPERGGTL